MTLPAPHTGKHARWWVLLAALACMAVTARLGWWQLERAAAKQRWQQAMAAQAAQAPLTNSAWRALLADGLAMQPPTAPVTGAAASPLVPEASAADRALLHRPVQLTGRWQRDHTVYLENRQMQGRVGFYVLTALLLDGGGAVLVQRGWAPRHAHERTQLPAVHTPTDTVTVTGRIAAAPAQLFALGDTAEARDAQQPAIRLNLDMPAYAQETGLPLPTWSVVQTDPASDGLLRHWPAVETGVAKHYGYAFQWFGLCALVAGLFVWFQVVRPWRRARTTLAHVC